MGMRGYNIILWNHRPEGEQYVNIGGVAYVLVAKISLKQQSLELMHVIYCETRQLER